MVGGVKGGLSGRPILNMCYDIFVYISAFSFVVVILYVSISRFVFYDTIVFGRWKGIVFVRCYRIRKKISI